MPIRITPPPSPVRASTESLLKKKEAQRTQAVFRSLLLLLAIVHFLTIAVLSGGGLSAYFHSWRSFVHLLLDRPYLAPILFVALWLIYKSVDLWRNPSPKEIVLPPYPPKPDLRWENKIYIGSGWTRNGKQPGEVYALSDDTDELFDAENCHVILNELGLFGNIQVTGGVGSGKTSTLIQPFIYQGISKFPKPPKPEEFELGPDGRYVRRPSPYVRNKNRFKDLARRWFGFEWGDPQPSLPPELDWQPYAGMTPDEARKEYERLMDEHLRRRWAMFIMDPKGDLTEFVLRVATMCNRAEDVVVLRPDGESTYNPLIINANPGVQAELVMDGIEAVSGQPIQQYWRGTMAEWLENALALLRIVEPTRITFKSVLRLARNETLRTQMVAEAEAIMREAQQEEERLRRLGRQYTGVRVDPTVIEFFQDWDSEDADPQQKRAVVSGIKTQSKFFVNSELAPFLCPEMPPTFKGFETMIDKGQIVVLRMPLDIYGPVARVLGILVMADAQQAARARINRPDINQERVVAFVVDEISAYLNRSTKDFIAMNRQSRVCFLAAHQTQGQLIQHGDRGFQDSFKDNLRTKIAFSTPNADAARKEASIMGSRHVFKQTITESQSYHRVERLDADVIAPKSPEAASMSVRVDEVERYWFAPEEFMKLRTGECIIMEFDGETTRPPRKIKAEAFWQSPLQPIAASQEIDLRIRPPHPIVVVGREPRDEEYFGSALTQSGYVIVQPLGTQDGVLAGFKFVTDVGTVILSCEQLDELEEIAQDRLADQQLLVLFTDLPTCGRFFAHHLGVELSRVLDFIATYRKLQPAVQATDFAGLIQEIIGYTLTMPERGSWEFHQDLERNHDAILADSRATIKLFGALGDLLYAETDDTLELLYEETRQRIDDLDLDALPKVIEDEADAASPAASDWVPTDDPTPNDGMPALDVEESINSLIADLDTHHQAENDPFASDHYPDELDQEGLGQAELSLVQPLGGSRPGSKSVSSNKEPASVPQASSASPHKAAKKRARSLLSLFEEFYDDDVLGHDTDLMSLQFPIDFEAALRLADDSPEKSLAQQDSDTNRAGSGRKNRRAHARTSRRATRWNNSQTSLDLGLSTNPSTYLDDRSTKSRKNNSYPNVVEGAPLD